MYVYVYMCMYICICVYVYIVIFFHLKLIVQTISCTVLLQKYDTLINFVIIIIVSFLHKRMALMVLFR